MFLIVCHTKSDKHSLLDQKIKKKEKDICCCT